MNVMQGINLANMVLNLISNCCIVLVESGMWRLGNLPLAIALQPYIVKDRQP